MVTITAEYMGKRDRGHTVEVDKFDGGHPDMLTSDTLIRVEHFATRKDAIGYVSDINNGIPHETAMKNVARKVRARENARAKNDAMKSVGMKRTPYGWE